MSQKFENILNLALETPQEERKLTEDLDVGYDRDTNTWQVIIKYNGSLDRLGEFAVQVEELIAGYGIVTIGEEEIERLSQMEEIEYVEKPKAYYYSQLSPVADPCIATVLATPPYDTGKGVLMAILDSGVDVRRREFRNPDGTTRIKGYLELLQGKRREYSEKEINLALEGRGELPSLSQTTHGTAVAGVACGYAEQTYGENTGTYRGVAGGCDMLVVNLGNEQEAYTQTTNIMRGVNYALEQAAWRKQPVVMNLSFGSDYGNHRGESLLERFLNNAAEIGRTCICVGMGNEGDKGKHFSHALEGSYLARFVVPAFSKNVTLQIWQDFKGARELRMVDPKGREILLDERTLRGRFQMKMEETLLLCYFGEPSPYSTSQEIYLELAAQEGYLDNGIWEVGGEGNCDLYLSGGDGTQNAYFFTPDSRGTLTIPATAERVLSVGAYDFTTKVYSVFSGRGFEGDDKPDVVAPGVDILAPWGDSGYRGFTGTSFATPVAAGCAALLMERGIVKKEDLYMYGEKLKAYLRAGALSLPGFGEIPNERTGWGRVCLRESMSLIVS